MIQMTIGTDFMRYCQGIAGAFPEAPLMAPRLLKTRWLSRCFLPCGRMSSFDGRNRLVSPENYAMQVDSLDHFIGRPDLKGIDYLGDCREEISAKDPCQHGGEDPQG
jgi:hypothetical protein